MLTASRVSTVPDAVGPSVKEWGTQQKGVAVGEPVGFASCCGVGFPCYPVGLSLFGHLGASLTVGHQGYTPLMEAAIFGHGKVAQQLITAGESGPPRDRYEVGTTEGAMWSRDHQKSVRTTEGAMWSLWVHFYGNIPPDISLTVPSDVALGPGARC